MDDAAPWLEDLSRPPVAQRARTSVAIDRAITVAGQVLLVVAVLFFAVGLNPLSSDDGESAGGDMARQLVFLALAGASVPLVLLRWRSALALAPRCWMLFLVHLALAATVLWSAYPGVSLRRLIVMLIVLFVAFAIAATLRSPRQYILPLAAAFAMALIGDYAVTVASPGRAFSDIGLAGFHSSKNNAGAFAMLAAIVFAGALIAVRRPLAFWGLVVLLLLDLVFLALTLSKTSLGLTLLCIGGIMPLYVACRTSGAMALLGMAGFVCLVGLIVVVTGAFGLTGADWAEIVTGDPTLTERDQIWSAMVRHMQGHLWLGYGFGAQWSMLPVYHPLWGYAGFWTGNDENLAILRQSHNGYIDIMISGGIFLATVVALFFLKIGADIIASTFKRSGDRWDVAGSAIFATYVVAFLFSNMLETSLFFPDKMLGQMLVFFVAAHHGWQMEPAATRRGTTGERPNVR